MYIETGNDIKIPEGFTFTGFHTGFKKDRGSDTALIHSRKGVNWAGVFTRNRVRAHCVVRNEQVLDGGTPVRAIIANSGNANACTGKKGEEANNEMARAAADMVGCKSHEVLTASTGVIGVPLQAELFEAALQSQGNCLGSKKEQLFQAAEAIMTTDTVRKCASVTFTIGEKSYTITGMAKGSGMIHPNMGTMLGFICTDYPIPSTLLQSTLKLVVDDTFNMISVDGDTSTNDMVLLLAPPQLLRQESLTEGGEDLYSFRSALFALCKHLAVAIAADGEGASKLLRCSVNGASNLIQAKVLAKGVIGSSLVKCAFFGEDANWGRIIAAMGYSGADFDPDRVDISFKSFDGEKVIVLMKDGAPLPFSEEKASTILASEQIEITINLGEGSASATAWGCDLSYNYVKINGDYRT